MMPAVVSVSSGPTGNASARAAASHAPAVGEAAIDDVVPPVEYLQRVPVGPTTCRQGPARRSLSSAACLQLTEPSTQRVDEESVVCWRAARWWSPASVTTVIGQQPPLRRMGVTSDQGPITANSAAFIDRI